MTEPRAPGRVARLAWATDVHLNFLYGPQIMAFCDALAAGDPDAVVLTGDIAEAPSIERLLGVVAGALERPIYFVLGNHDAYHGSLAEVRARMRELTAESPYLRYLPAISTVELAPGVALVGHDGWADGRLGNYRRSPIVLNDYLLIEELAGRDKGARLAAIQRLGDEAAAYFARVLPEALARYDRVVVATHVPPFEEACWHEGRISDGDWLPHFTCKAVGDVLRGAARAHPARRIEVLCGHTHGAGVAEILPNLVVRTGGAKYGAPEVQAVLSIEGPAEGPTRSP